MIRQLHIQDADNTYSCHVRLHRRLVEVQSVSRGRDSKLMRGVALSTSDTIVLTYCQALRRGGEGLGG